ATDKIVATSATDAASTQAMSRMPAVAPIASAPTPAIATATNVCRNVLTARSPAPFQNAIVHILTPTVHFSTYLLVHAITHAKRLPAVSVAITVLTLDNLSSHLAHALTFRCR